MSLPFPELVLVLGLLLVVTGALSGLAHGTVISVSILAVAAGMALDLLGLFSVSPTDESVIVLIELALLFTLFSDGLVVERELLTGGKQGPTLRALAIAMPLSTVLVAVIAKLMFGDLSWPEALLLGAVLAPTDPVITSSVVESPGIPARLRHILNLESGLNDGLALPFVLIFITIAATGDTPEGDIAKLLGEAGVGLLIGVGLATIAGRSVDDIPGLQLRGKYEGVFALGIALAAFGLAESTWGNGFIAAFTAGIALGIAERDTPVAFREFNESVGAVLQTLTFFIFGSLVIDAGVPAPAIATAALVGFALFIARPGSILVALVGSDLGRLQSRFLAWFGPKGVASMLFSLFVLKSNVPQAELIFQLASMVILASIIAHGLTDTVGARWLDRKLVAEAEREGQA